MSLFFTHIQARRYEFTYRNHFYIEHQSRLKRQQSEFLLSKVLPPIVSHELKRGRRYASDIECGIIMFAKLKNFDNIALSREPQELVSFLNRVFSHWDDLIDQREQYYDVVKVETVGPVYMVGSRILPKSNRALATLQEEAAAVAD